MHQVDDKSDVVFIFKIRSSRYDLDKKNYIAWDDYITLQLCGKWIDALITEL